MPLKTPKFWYRKPGTKTPVLEHALKPISFLYQAGHQINQSRKTPFKADIPVICVGNAVVGGSGKTPTAIALKKLIHTTYSDLKIYFLTRGYKGNMRSAILVDDHMHTHIDIGDEALLLTRHAPTIKSINRMEGLKRAVDEKADLVIMDDGLQNNSIHKDISFIVIDGANGLGNGKTIPAGPLREPLDTALKKADAFIIIGPDTRGIQKSLPHDKPVFSAHIKSNAKQLKSKKVIAFCGLGIPEKFKNTLEKEGFDIAEWHSFADHHDFSDKELEKLIKKAKKLDAKLITTEKDLVRITNADMRKQIDVLKIDLAFDNPQDVLNSMKEHLV